MTDKERISASEKQIEVLKEALNTKGYLLQLALLEGKAIGENYRLLKEDEKIDYDQLAEALIRRWK